MGKLKVYELAKEMNLTNQEMIEKLKNIGVEVKSHLSTVEDSVVEKLKGGATKKTEKASKEEKKQEQMHIIRRNVRVINTSETGSEVNEITSTADGNIKKSYQTNARPAKSQSSQQTRPMNINGQNKTRTNNNPYANRNRFQNNRNNIVITRNGKPVEAPKPEPVVEKKTEVVAPAVVEETKPVVAPDTQKAPVVQESQPKEVTKVENKATEVANTNNNANNTNNQNRNYNKNNNYNNNRQNRDNRDNNGFRKNNYNSQNNPNYNRNSNDRNNNNNNRQGGFNRNNQNGDRPQRNNNFRNNRQNSDNTSYQVNKFIKQAERDVIEQKETRDYSSENISRDKKKYNDKNNQNMENRREKLDKNKLREEHSRVSTGKLRNMEISQDGLMDLYERDSDLRKGSGKKKKAKEEKAPMHIVPMTEVKLPETMTVKDFAEAIKKQASEVIKKLFSMGIMATVNQDIDFDTAYLIASEFGITAEKQVVVTEEDILFDDSEDAEEDLVPRPPIVVVMGHVDHGKTSLLDRLRQTNVVEGEAGGITQHIGAYKVKVKDREVCFLDTPGHEAFTAMRARGAQITDIAIIIVAADDGIKPQTVEAIDHAKAAGVSILVAINKIDKPGANVEKVKQELMNYDLVPEEWGGDTICVPISAKTGEGIDNLLEMLLLIADMKDLKANPNKQAKGTVIEARLDKTRGTVVSMLVQRGQLNVGDTIVVGDMVSKIRAMKDDKGRSVKMAGPSTPVEILGLSHVPETGEVFYEVENEKVAKHLIEKRIAKQRMDLIKQGSKITLDDLFGQIKQGKIKDLNIIIKADVQGSVEAMRDSLEKLSNDEVRVRVIHASTGGIKESDVTLASVSNAIIIGFNVRPESAAEQQAKKEQVDMRLYSVIYDAINDVEVALQGMMPKKYKEVKYGTAEVRKVFKITGVGIVAGCYVKSGKIIRGAMVRLVRDNIVLLEIKIDSLKREKDDVKEVAENYECGIKLENFSDIKEGDIFECFTMEEVK
ncbi:MAG: translation initiation factor IF-2 [Clostridia bacterium]|nr:translation initiation factor IF-2 [Clostridia bacterium]